MLKTLIVGALVAAALAQPAACKEFSKTAPEAIHWPLLWTDSQTLDYDESTEHILETGGVGTHSHSSGITRISSMRGGKDGAMQGWTSLVTLKRETNASEAEQAFMREMDQAFAGTTLEVKLSEDGTFAGIANIEAIQSRFQKVFNASLERMADGKKNPLSADDEKARQRLLAAYTSAPVLEGQLSILPKAYNFPSGGGLGLDHEYVYEDMGANPIGGDPFPLTGRMTLRRDELHDGWLMLEWTVGIDREKGGPVLADTIRKLLGEEIFAKENKQQVLEQLFADLDIGSSARFRIDPKTGVVQWMQFVQRRRVADRNDVRSTTLSLRAEPYVPKAVDTTPAPGG